MWHWKVLPTCPDIKTKTWWIYLVLDSNARKLGLSFQIHLESLAQIPWIWWTDDAEIMKFAGDKLMIILQILTPGTSNIYVSISWDQDSFNELVPAVYDEDSAEVWCKTYQKPYGFNLFSTASSSYETGASSLDAPGSFCIACISHLNLELQYSWSYHLLSPQISPYAMVSSLLDLLDYY